MLKKIISFIVLLAFTLTSLSIPAKADVVNLPTPGSMVSLSPNFEPTLIKGLTVHKDNPFLFDFIVDTGNSNLKGDALKEEGDRLVKYFFACMTIPEKDLWVNLSPYEKQRMIPRALGQTALGRDLLAEDYILKQLTASLIYPEKSLGKEFWDRVYAKAQAEFGTTQIPVNTFNKVWILADHADVYENGQTAFVLDGHLKVMLEEDYLALQKHSTGGVIASPKGEAISKRTTKDTHSIASNIIRQIVLPEIEHEVNYGQNFATLRQIYNSLILASWYKQSLKQAILTQVYADKSTVKGVNLSDPSVKQRIYEQYLKAYKKGVFNYIKEEEVSSPNASIGDPEHATIPRKYFSGGFGVAPDFENDVNRNSPKGAAMIAQAMRKLGNIGSVLLMMVALGVDGALPVLADTNVPLSASHAMTSTRRALDSQLKEIFKRLKSPDVDIFYEEDPLQRSQFYKLDNPATVEAILRDLRRQADASAWEKGFNANLILTTPHYSKIDINPAMSSLKNTSQAMLTPRSKIGTGLSILVAMAVLAPTYNWWNSSRKELGKLTYDLLEAQGETNVVRSKQIDDLRQVDIKAGARSGNYFYGNAFEQIEIDALHSLANLEHKPEHMGPAIYLGQFSNYPTGVWKETVVTPDGEVLTRSYTHDHGENKYLPLNNTPVPLNNHAMSAQKSNVNVFTDFDEVLNAESRHPGTVLGQEGSLYAYDMTPGWVKIEKLSKEGISAQGIDVPSGKYWITKENFQKLSVNQAMSAASPQFPFGRDAAMAGNIGKVFSERDLKVKESEDFSSDLLARGNQQGVHLGNTSHVTNRLPMIMGATANGDIKFAPFGKNVQGAVLQTQKDKAQINGGIDLNSANMAMTVTKDARGGVRVNFNPALIAQIKAHGIWSAEPFILSIKSMDPAQIRPLLGVGP